MPMKTYFFQLNYYKEGCKDPRVIIVCAAFLTLKNACKWAKVMEEQAMNLQNSEYPKLRTRPTFQKKKDAWPQPRSLPVSRIRNPGQAGIEDILGRRAFQRAA